MNWSQTCAMWKERYPVVLPKHFEHGDEEPVNVYAFIKEVSSRLKEGQITVVGNGSACVVGGHAYVLKKGQRFISNSAIAAMGYDLPAPTWLMIPIKQSRIKGLPSKARHSPKVGHPSANRR